MEKLFTTDYGCFLSLSDWRRCLKKSPLFLRKKGQCPKTLSLIHKQSLLTALIKLERTSIFGQLRLKNACLHQKWYMIHAPKTDKDGFSSSYGIYYQFLFDANSRKRCIDDVIFWHIYVLENVGIFFFVERTNLNLQSKCDSKSCFLLFTKKVPVCLCRQFTSSTLSVTTLWPK